MFKKSREGNTKTKEMTLCSNADWLRSCLGGLLIVLETSLLTYKASSDLDK